MYRYCVVKINEQGGYEYNELKEQLIQKFDYLEQALRVVEKLTIESRNKKSDDIVGIKLEWN